MSSNVLRKERDLQTTDVTIDVTEQGGGAWRSCCDALSCFVFQSSPEGDGSRASSGPGAAGSRAEVPPHRTVSGTLLVQKRRGVPGTESASPSTVLGTRQVPGTPHFRV